MPAIEAPAKLSDLWNNPLVRYGVPVMLALALLGGFLTWRGCKRSDNAPPEVKERVKKAENLPTVDDYASRRKRLQDALRECEKGSKCPVRRDR